ncbi:MAG: hypothetical protein KGV59_00920 [Tenacibaculum sp.]|nr:hypothetical protein [Tenacibaculum sp.]
MEQETDFILKEIKKITYFLSKLISNISTSNNFEIENIINETDEFLKEKWKLSFNEITTLNEIDFLNKLENLPEIHLDKFVELLSEIINKLKTSELQNKYNKNELANKTIVLIDKINKNSKDLSLKRMQIKNNLQQEVHNIFN